MYTHQDWTPVVFRKNKPSSEQGKRHSSNSSTFTTTATGRPAYKIEQQVDNQDGAKPLTYVSSATANAIVQGRVAEKMKREDLAKAVVVCFTVLGGTARAHRTPAQKRAGFPGTNIEKGSRVAN